MLTVALWGMEKTGIKSMPFLVSGGTNHAHLTVKYQPATWGSQLALHGSTEVGERVNGTGFLCEREHPVRVHGVCLGDSADEQRGSGCTSRVHRCGGECGRACDAGEAGGEMGKMEQLAGGGR